jgi:hypothetical protein
MEGMTIAEAVELVDDARAEGLLRGTGGLEEFARLEETIRRLDGWFPADGASWERAAAEHPELVERVTERVLERGIDPARLAAALIAGQAGGGQVQRELALVACEVAAWCATAPE